MRFLLLFAIVLLVNLTLAVDNQQETKHHELAAYTPGGGSLLSLARIANMAPKSIEPTTKVDLKKVAVDDDDDEEDDEDEEDDDTAASDADDDEDEEEDEDEEDDEVEIVAGDIKTTNSTGSSQGVLSNLISRFSRRSDANQTSLIHKRNHQSRTNHARSLGLLTLKAIILGPLIGLTIKAALIRGILYALAAYALHLFFPALLSSIGLGTGLVGFARQLQPSYVQMLAPHLMAGLQHTLPVSVGRLASQYQQLFAPVVDSIRSIPEGHCRYRAVCETASQLMRNVRSMSSTLQRISATVYTQFGSDYSKAWLDGVVQSDCAAKYAQCHQSPFTLVASKLAQSFNAQQSSALLTSAPVIDGQLQQQQQQQLSTPPIN